MDSNEYWLSDEEMAWLRIEDCMCPQCGKYLEPEEICFCLDEF
jgi:hypothetical protein